MVAVVVDGQAEPGGHTIQLVAAAREYVPAEQVTIVLVVL